MPAAQKLGLISILLSQYATITGERELTLSDGSKAHQYSISIGYDQLQKLQLPPDKSIEASLIITQQHGKTYLLVFGTVQGTMQRYQSNFANILQSVSIGGASFSSTTTSEISPPPESSNFVPGNDTQILMNDTNINNPANTLLSSEGTNEMMGNMTGGCMGAECNEYCKHTVCKNVDDAVGGSMTVGNATLGGASVTISPGSSSPSNSKNFVPDTLPVKAGTTVTWTNADTTLHTVTSGTPEGGNSGTEFDSSYIAAGKTFQHAFNIPGTFDFYCTLHPFMKGKVVVS